MRDIKEILENKCLRNMEIGEDGGQGYIHIGGWDGSVIFSNGAGWEHVSVMPFAKRITPSWDDMCKLKEIFFEDFEVVIQIHPKKNEYVNNAGNCLHLWRCTYREMVLPPSVLVGVRNNQTPEQVRQEIREAYELARAGEWL